MVRNLPSDPIGYILSCDGVCICDDICSWYLGVLSRNANHRSIEDLGVTDE